MTTIASGSMLDSIKQLYNITTDINDFIEEHIKMMKTSGIKTIAQIGKVLEGAKYGANTGYTSSVTIIAVGQLLLGNPLAVVAAPVALTNPVALTCAAVGAIYYGWNALTDEEKKAILEKIRTGLNIGADYVKKIINYVLKVSKNIWNSENRHQMMKLIMIIARSFGKGLGDITKEKWDKLLSGFYCLIYWITNFRRKILVWVARKNGKATQRNQYFLGVKIFLK